MSPQRVAPSFHCCVYFFSASLAIFIWTIYLESNYKIDERCLDVITKRYYADKNINYCPTYEPLWLFPLSMAAVTGVVMSVMTLIEIKC